MNHSVLSVELNDNQACPPWLESLSGRGIAVYRAGRLAEAVAYCKTYPLVMAVIRVHQVDQPTIEAVSAIAEGIPTERSFPLVGLHEGELTTPERDQLAQAGLSGLASAADPERFITWQIDTLAALADLRRFEQARTDVGELAHRTRERMHDLNQPIAAIQGRLQLMAARAPDGDANARTFRDLLEQVDRITRIVDEIQQLHRDHS